MATRYRFQVDSQPHAVSVDEVDGRLTVTVDGGEPELVDGTTSGVPGLI